MFKTINKIIYTLSLLTAITFMSITVTLNVVPNKYLILIGVILIVIYLILGILTFKIKNKIASSIFIFLELLFGIVLCYGSYTIHKTNNFLINFTKKSEEKAYYYVVVLKDSKYNNLTDLKNQIIGTYSLNDDNYTKSLKEVNNKIKITTNEYDNLTNISTDLLNKKVDAILVSDFNKEILDDEINKFKDSIKIIYTVSIKITSKVNDAVDVAKKEPFNILISGIDTNGTISKVSRSDVNIIVTVNPQTNEILLTSIPRDYYVQLHGTTGSKDKLTHAGIYGIDMSVTTLEDLLNINIDYYLRVNFDTLVKVIDSIGGVDIESDTTFTAYSGDKFVQGTNHLNGSQALSYSRERKVFAEGDRKRGEHQEQVITAIINKITSSKVLLTNYSSILNNLSDSLQTSISTDTIKLFVKDQLDKMPTWNIKSISLDGVGTSAYTYSMPGWLLYVMVPNENTVNYSSRLINGIINNIKISELETE